MLTGSVPGLIDSLTGGTYERELLPLYHGAAIPAAILGAVVIAPAPHPHG
jgi:hypothetical protein